MSTSLETIPFEALVAEVERRYGKGWRNIKKRKCLGCGRMFGAREMRTHPCLVGWNKRLPYVAVETDAHWRSYRLDESRIPA